eukprot:215915_1
MDVSNKMYGMYDTANDPELSTEDSIVSVKLEPEESTVESIDTSTFPCIVKAESQHDSMLMDPMPVGFTASLPSQSIVSREIPRLEASFSCKACTESFSHKIDLIRHVTTSHSGRVPELLEPGTAVKSEHSSSSSSKCDAVDAAIKTEKCVEQSMSASSASNSEKNISPVFRFPCNTCPYTFWRVTSLHAHMRHSHPDTSETYLALMCNQC